jgi:DNA-binding transcriptional MerR regulator
MQTELRIGEVATRCGVSIDTLRYYERRHLLSPARRTRGGYRIFPPETVDRILFIKQAQDLGFSLDEISALLMTNGSSDCLRVHDLLDAKLTELDARMRSMQEFRKRLKHYLTECEDELRKHPGSVDCPVVVEILHREHN